MPTCSFCKKNYEIPRGLTVFTFDGKTVHFCSSKCKRNLNLKRDPKKVNWIKSEKKVKAIVEKVEKETPKTEEKIVEKGKKVDKKEVVEEKKK